VDILIPKNKLKGKYVVFFDRNHAQRSQRVIKITGNTLTVIDAVGVRTRIHPDKTKILGVYHYKKLEEISW